MERRVNTVKENWLLKVAKHILKNQKKIHIIERRSKDETKISCPVRSIGNYSCS
jgi:hypothetical protein